ncbi:MAG: gliding motility-associated C-terminal domain-containing protein [Ginsengibacter sp.]
MRKTFFLIFIVITNLSLGQVPNCNNWLSTPSYISAVNVGKIAVTGNQITVEATIYQTSVNPALGTGDIVSKHTDPSDDNYLLRPDYCSITTTNGFYQTGDICKVENNKTYHVAMVYDGNSLKFYRNGFLMSQLAATGSLIQNNQDTRIGYYAYQWWNTQFFGYINEVRIWDVARTQTQLRTYMNSSLTNPSTQPELLAYYTFDNLINKQGNAAWNGIMQGNATINQTIPDCSFAVDSCSIPVSVPYIINNYTEVLAFDICKNELKVSDATKYNAGDTVMIMQMKGAVIDSNNAATFGDIINYHNSGNYEMNIVKAKNGNSLSLLNVLQRQYDIPNGKVQLIRVPYYNNYTVNNTLTCLPWDGSKGGVLVLNAKNSVALNANIDVSGRGFLGGRSPNPNTTTLYCNYNNFYYANGEAGAADKGESITTFGDAIAWGKGSAANGGGGGNGHNSGGGGGSNGGVGGFGGYQLDACGGSATDNRGIGGKNLAYSTGANKIFMGGGGGSGQTDNAGGSSMNGANGGGIVIIKSPVINNAGFKIIAKGADIINCALSSIDLCHDGNGGGGGGGAVLLETNNINNATSVDISGGKGGDLVVFFQPNATHIGPGGGGGAGVFWSNSANVPANILMNKTGGINGVIIPDGNNPYGTTPGQDGINLFNLKLPVDLILFKPNIDSVRIKDSTTSCSNFTFKGQGFTNTSAIATWRWTFGDGGSDSKQNTSHSYQSPGNFNVKLIVTDVNGCIDSISIPVTTSLLNTTKNKDTTLCGSQAVQFAVTGGTTYLWSPSSTLSNTNIYNPIATPLTTTTYYVTVTNANGCTKNDSIKVTVKSIPVITKSNDTTICKNAPFQLFASGGSSYTWSPASSLNNANISNPIATPSNSTTYKLIVTGSNGCSNTDSVKLTLNPIPIISQSNDTTICPNNSVNIFATGGTFYLWSPANSLNDATSSSPLAFPTVTTNYKVVIKDAYSCSYNDSVKVSVSVPPVFSVTQDGSICEGKSKQLVALGGDTYEWTPADGLSDANINNPIASPGVSTTYSVTIHKHLCNITDIYTTKLLVLPLPQVKATSSNDLTCALGTSQLNATGATNYTWSPSTGLNNSNIENPIASPANTTVYKVVGINGSGCSNVDTVVVKTDFNMNALYLLPNSFTPNGDGINDCFGIKYWGVVQKLDFSIYNRFGERVFYTNNAANCWDGTYKQNLQDANVYVYIIKAKTACGTIERKGTVTLIK